jgi:hypothetical protein
MLHEDRDDPSSDNQHSKSKAELIIGNNKDNTESLSLGNIENMSDEGESNTYTTDGCREILAKVSSFCLFFFDRSHHQLKQKIVSSFA